MNNICTPIGYRVDTHFDNDEECENQIAFELCPSELSHHCHIAGGTGSGKTTLIEHLALNDIEQGRGLLVADLHGDMQARLINAIPEHRKDDVIYIDPTDPTHSVGLNLLADIPEQLISPYAAQIVSIIHSLNENSWGPQLDDLLRNSLISLMSMPNATLFGLIRILGDERTSHGGTYREHVISHVKNPAIRHFWEHQFNKWDNRKLQDAISPVLNKIRTFFTNDALSHILNQEKSTIDFRAAMDEGKIIILNLDQTKIGIDDAEFLYSLLIAKFYIDATSRSDIPECERRPFTLYLDEIDALHTSKLAKVIDDLRKYKVAAVLSHQDLSQLSDRTASALLTNAQTTITFGLNGDDIPRFARQMVKAFLINGDYMGQLDYRTALGRAETELASVEQYQAFIRVTKDGEPVTCRLDLLPPRNIPDDQACAIEVKKLSQKKYGTKREKIHNFIMTQVNVGEKQTKHSRHKKRPGTHGIPQITISDHGDELRLNSAFCAEAGIDNFKTCFAILQYSSSTETMRIGFSETRVKGSIKLIMKKHSASFPTAEFNRQHRINLIGFSGKYKNLSRVFDEKGRRWEMFKLRRS